MKNKNICRTVIACLSMVLLSGCTVNGTKSAETAKTTKTTEATKSTETTKSTDAASSTDQVKKYDNPASGISFVLPQSWVDNLQGAKNLELSGFECALDVRFMTPLGLDMAEKVESSSKENSNNQGQNDLAKKMVEQNLPVLCIIAEYEGGPDPEVFRYGYADEKPLGEVNGTRYSLLYNKTPDLSKVEGETKDLYLSMVAEVDKVAESLELSGHKALGDGIEFKTQTIGGKDIDSSIFKDYDLTAINVWATWCTPCVGELPELQKVYEGLPENVNLIGICTDAKSEPELAAKMVEELGLTYPNIVANKEMEEDFLVYITSLPTTVFVDSNGNFVGNPMIGVPYEDVADTYLYTIEKRLALAKDGGNADE